MIPTLQLGGMGRRVKGGVLTYATWNPADKGAGVTLSNSNLTMTMAAGGIARSTIGVTSGKWYWEITRGAGVDCVAGIANSSASLTVYLGSDANGWGYIGSNGNKLNNATSAAYGSAYSSANVIGVYLDMDAGTLEFLRGNVSQGIAYTGLTGTIFAAGGTNNSGDGQTANFGATAFTYAPPAGSNAGLYA